MKSLIDTMLANYIRPLASRLRLRLTSTARLVATAKRRRWQPLECGMRNTLKPSKTIATIKFGSHLYGTATETSDDDYNGIFLPSLEEILLGRIPKTSASSPKDDTRKNEAGELDIEYYSLHHFVKLACQGQTVALDMLFAPDSMVQVEHDYAGVWQSLRANRHLFLSRNMQAFVGYARAQASKYSLKGDRLNKLTLARDILVEALPGTILMAFGDRLIAEGCVQDTRQNPQNVKEYQIGGKWFGESTTVANVLVSINNSIGRYGKRAQASADAEGVDWKALSHAVRVSKELIELLTFREIRFPLETAPLLLKIKKGEVPLEEVQGMLDTDLAFIELQAHNSKLPENVDHKWWDNWLVQTMIDHLADEMVLLMDGHEEER